MCTSAQMKKYLRAYEAEVNKQLGSLSSFPTQYSNARGEIKTLASESAAEASPVAASCLEAKLNALREGRLTHGTEQEVLGASILSAIGNIWREAEKQYLSNEEQELQGGEEDAQGIDNYNGLERYRDAAINHPILMPDDYWGFMLGLSNSAAAYYRSVLREDGFDFEKIPVKLVCDVLDGHEGYESNYSYWIVTMRPKPPEPEPEEPSDPLVDALNNIIGLLSEEQRRQLL